MRRLLSVAAIAWASLKLPRLYPKNKFDPVRWRPLLRFCGDGAAKEAGIFGEHDRLFAGYKPDTIETGLFMSNRR
jgi:hypothetical protein